MVPYDPPGGLPGIVSLGNSNLPGHRAAFRRDRKKATRLVQAWQRPPALPSPCFPFLCCAALPCVTALSLVALFFQLKKLIREDPLLKRQQPKPWYLPLRRNKLYPDRYARFFGLQEECICGPVYSRVICSYPSHDETSFCRPLFLPPCTVPCKIVLASPDDLDTCPNHFNLRFFTVVKVSS